MKKAKVRLVLDTRKSSKSSVTGLYPITIRLFYKKQRHIRLPYYTSRNGWDEVNYKLKKSVLANKNQSCDYINKIIYNKLHHAKKLINELGE